MLSILLLAGLTTFPLPVLGNTWVVDDSGGPDVNFTSIQAAIDASAPNDVLIVRAGTYATSTLDKGLRIVGEGGPLLLGTMRIQNLPAQSLAVVSGLRTNPGPIEPGLTVTNCLGTVVGEDFQGGSVSITDSLDVRLRGVVTPSSYTALLLTNSRVEVVESTFRGRDGPYQLCGVPFNPDGWDAASVVNGELHAARSSFRGGDGGDAFCPDLGSDGPAGVGGHGIQASGPITRVLVSGLVTDLLVGGQGGYSYTWGNEPDGYGLYMTYSSQARVSGATIDSQATFGGTAAITTVVPPDPTLRMLELPAPGVNLTFRLVAPAGSSARLRIGPLPAIVPIGGLEEDVLVARAQTVGSGTVPAGDVLGFNFPIGASWPRGTTVFAQAVVTLPGGEVRRTHSIPIVVR